MNIHSFPTISLDLLIEARNRRGKVVALHSVPSRSYVRAFVDMLYAQSTGSPVTLVPDTGGTLRTIAIPHNINALGPDNDSTFGLVLGTGTNAVTITDNKLQTQILHGVIANTLDHELGARQNLLTIGNTRKFELRRLFVNASGAPITINECGVYTWTSTFFFCIVRDRVSPSVTIPNGGTGTLIYTIGASV